MLAPASRAARRAADALLSAASAADVRRASDELLRATYRELGVRRGTLAPGAEALSAYIAERLTADSFVLILNSGVPAAVCTVLDAVGAGRSRAAPSNPALLERAIQRIMTGGGLVATLALLPRLAAQLPPRFWASAARSSSGATPPPVPLETAPPHEQLTLALSALAYVFTMPCIVQELRRPPCQSVLKAALEAAVDCFRPVTVAPDSTPQFALHAAAALALSRLALCDDGAAALTSAEEAAARYIGAVRDALDFFSRVANPAAWASGGDAMQRLSVSAVPAVAAAAAAGAEPRLARWLLRDAAGGASVAGPALRWLVLRCPLLNRISAGADGAERLRASQQRALILNAVAAVARSNEYWSTLAAPAAGAAAPDAGAAAQLLLALQAAAKHHPDAPAAAAAAAAVEAVGKQLSTVAGLKQPQTLDGCSDEEEGRNAGREALVYATARRWAGGEQHGEGGGAVAR